MSRLHDEKTGTTKKHSCDIGKTVWNFNMPMNQRSGKHGGKNEQI